MRHLLTASLLLAAATAEAQNPARVLLTPDSLSVNAANQRYVQKGDTVRLDAKVYATNGMRVADPRLTWTPMNANTRLLAGGPSYVRVIALDTGSVAVKVTWIRNDAQRPSASASYRALRKTNAASLSPTAVTIAEGDSVLFTMTLLDQQGMHITDRKPAWALSDTTVAWLRVVASNPQTAWVKAKPCGPLCGGKLGYLRGPFQRLTWFTADESGTLRKAGT
jgi:hypothetical protein